MPWRPGGGAFVPTVSGGWDLETFEPFDRRAGLHGRDPAVRPARARQAGLQRRPRRASSCAGGSCPGRPPCSRASTGSGSRPELGPSAPSRRAGAPGPAWPAWSRLTWPARSRAATGRHQRRARLHLELARQREAEWLPLETTSLKPATSTTSAPTRGGMPGYTSHRGYLDGHALLAAQYTAQLSVLRAPRLPAVRRLQRRPVQGRALRRRRAGPVAARGGGGRVHQAHLQASRRVAQPARLRVRQDRGFRAPPGHVLSARRS